MKSDILKSSYEILKDKELILEVLLGVVTLEKLKTVRNILYSDRDYTPHFNSIIDVRDAKIEISPMEFQSYINYLFGNNLFVSRKSAIILKDSDLKEYGEEFNALNGKIPLEFNVFSNPYACMEWLNIKGAHIEEVISCFEDMKREPHYQWFNQPNSIMGI